MQTFPNGTRLVESPSDLPDLRNARRLYGDFETTSYDDKKDSLNPWHDCWAAGVGVTVDDAPGAWYVPMRHRHGPNLPVEVVREWWADTLGTAKRWTNSNVKYDAHVSANDMGFIPDWPEMELFDIVTHAKIIDSDRHFRGGYGIDALSKGWLHEDIGAYEENIKRWLVDSKDYGRVPSYEMAPYCGQDVLSARRLEKYIEHCRHSDCERVAGIETNLTSVLFQLERNGMRVDPIELLKEELGMSMRLLEIDRELFDLTGRSVNPSSNDQLYDLFICQYGLPVVAYTEEDKDGNPCGNASFDKNALKLYALMPYAPTRVIELVQEARTLGQTLSLFVKPYQVFRDANGRLHPTFNQCVRTGRLSCSKPNMQQLSKVAKRLIHPDDGYAFLSMDQSQIEFRVIVHYIQNQRCIKAYHENPDTDFHQWVADSAGFKRKPAKTLNFMMGYGGGKKKAVAAMSMNKDVVGELEHRVDEMVANGQLATEQREAMFKQLATIKGERVYDDYHMNLPELKPMARRAMMVCRDRGYVRNVHGRHRHMPVEAAHKAFNTLCQGEAADIQKERTVATARAIKDTPIMMVGNVHDETVLEGPREIMRDTRVQHALACVQETLDVPLRVPIRCSVGYSEKHWAEASTDVKDGGTSGPVHYDRQSIDLEDPLRFVKS